MNHAATGLSNNRLLTQCIRKDSSEITHRSSKLRRAFADTVAFAAGPLRLRLAQVHLTEEGDGRELTTVIKRFVLQGWASFGFGLDLTVFRFRLFM